MTIPEYIANPTDHPAHRGNTSESQDRPWYGPTNDQERLGVLWALHGALCSAKTIASSLGTSTDDYETTIECLIERASKERRAILEGCK